MLVFFEEEELKTQMKMNNFYLVSGPRVYVCLSSLDLA